MECVQIFNVPSLHWALLRFRVIEIFFSDSLTHAVIQAAE